MVVQLVKNTLDQISQRANKFPKTKTKNIKVRAENKKS